MIPPEFSAWLAEQMKKESDQQKAARKLREEALAEAERLRLEAEAEAARLKAMAKQLSLAEAYGMGWFHRFKYSKVKAEAILEAKAEGRNWVRTRTPKQRSIERSPKRSLVAYICRA